MEAFSFSDLLQALSSLAWPAIVCAALVKFYPDLKKIIATRTFTISAAGVSISVQQATDQLQRQLDELKSSLLRDQQADTSAVDEGEKHIPKNILWVDDEPENWALMMSSFDPPKGRSPQA